MKGIVKGIAGDKGASCDKIFLKSVIVELVHGSSLICLDKEEGAGEERVQEGCIYRMHRLVSRFIVRDIGRGSRFWNEMYIVALIIVHERVETELKKEVQSFENCPLYLDTVTVNSWNTLYHKLTIIRFRRNQLRYDMFRTWKAFIDTVERPMSLRVKQRKKCRPGKVWWTF